MDSEVKPLTKDDFLAIFRRATDTSFFDSVMSSDDDGRFILEMMAEQLEIQSTEAFDFYRSSNPSFAAEGKKATARITFERTDDTAEEVISAGSILKTPWGMIFVTQSEIRFAVGDSGPLYTDALSAWGDDDYNVPAYSINIIDSLRNRASATTITCYNEDDASGGQKPLLDILAANKSIYRDNGETNQSLRVRMRTAPDKVTIAAIKRCVSRHMANAGTGYEAIYINGADAGFFFGRDHFDAGVAPTSPYYRKFKRMLLSKNDTHRSFFVIVPRLRLDNFHGLIFDSGKINRHSAIDQTGKYGFYDCTNLTEKSTYSALFRDLRSKAGAGIRHTLIAEWRL